MLPMNTPIRRELQTFAEAQEGVLRTHDADRGKEGWKDMSPQVGASRLCEEVGEILTELFGQDDVCDHLIASLQDHVEEASISLDYSATKLKRETADVGNFCMFLHDIADSIASGVPKTN
jgi:NTP pyrophosphatase (non-canonical NTP hydrolase)